MMQIAEAQAIRTRRRAAVSASDRLTKNARCGSAAAISAKIWKTPTRQIREARSRAKVANGEVSPSSIAFLTLAPASGRSTR